MGSDFTTNKAATASADLNAAEEMLDLSRLTPESLSAEDESGSVELGWMDDLRNFDRF